MVIIMVTLNQLGNRYEYPLSNLTFRIFLRTSFYDFLVVCRERTAVCYSITSTFRVIAIDMKTSAKQMICTLTMHAEKNITGTRLIDHVSKKQEALELGLVSLCTP